MCLYKPSAFHGSYTDTDTDTDDDGWMIICVSVIFFGRNTVEVGRVSVF